MKFQLYDNKVRFLLGPNEPVDILKDLQDYFSYNDTDYRYALLMEARGIDNPEPDLTDPAVVMELACMSSDLWYQNFLSFIYNKLTDQPEKKLYKNVVRKERFIKKEMSNGYKSVLKIDYVKRSTVFDPGLLRMAIVFLQDHVESEYGLEWELYIEDKRQARIFLTPEPVYDWKHIKLRPAQRKAVDRIRETLADYDNYGYLFSRIMLDLSVNFGKTYTLYILSKNFTREDGTPAPVIWFYSDRELLSKAVNDYLPLEPELTVIAADRSYVNGYLKERGVTDRPVYDEKGAFTLAMEQTLDSRLKSKRKGKKIDARYLKHYLTGVYDECHKGGNDRANRVLSRFRFGVLAGASGSPTSSLSGLSRYGVTGQFGGVRCTVSFKDTVDMGTSLPLEVRRMYNPIPTNYPTNQYNVGGIKKKGVYYSDQRYELLKYALTESLKEERQTLIYGGSLQLKYLEAWYEQLIGDGFTLDYTSGDDPKRIRKIADFSDRKTEVILSNKIMGTGIDISTIGSLIYVNPTDNEIDVMQAPIGRLGRLYKDELIKVSNGLIWDFYDDDTYYDVGTMETLLFNEEPEQDNGPKTVPGELTRISEIRSLYYKRQNIPVIDINPLEL